MDHEDPSGTQPDGPDRDARTLYLDDAHDIDVLLHVAPVRTASRDGRMLAEPGPQAFTWLPVPLLVKRGELPERAGTVTELSFGRDDGWLTGTARIDASCPAAPALAQALAQHAALPLGVDLATGFSLADDADVLVVSGWSVAAVTLYLDGSEPAFPDARAYLPPQGRS